MSWNPWVLMCWRCKQRKPRAGGEFPDGPGSERFRCADCKAKRLARQAAKQAESRP